MATVGFAGTASAAASDCPSTYACTWRDANYQTNGSGTALVKFFACHHDFRVSNYTGMSNANDSASSVSNRGTQSSATFYVDNLYKGASFTLAKGTGDGNLSDSSGHAPGGFNDKLSSAKFSGYGTDCR
ncbi:peptidase inhibitor family I36 protein [Cellulomonas triticagri]